MPFGTKCIQNWTSQLSSDSEAAKARSLSLATSKCNLFHPTPILRPAQVSHSRPQFLLPTVCHALSLGNRPSLPSSLPPAHILISPAERCVSGQQALRSQGRRWGEKCINLLLTPPVSIFFVTSETCKISRPLQSRPF